MQKANGKDIKRNSKIYNQEQILWVRNWIKRNKNKIKEIDKNGWILFHWTNSFISIRLFLHPTIIQFKLILFNFMYSSSSLAPILNYPSQKHKNLAAMENI